MTESGLGKEKSDDGAIYHSSYFSTAAARCAVAFDWGGAYSEVATAQLFSCHMHGTHGVRHLCSRGCYWAVFEPCRLYYKTWVEIGLQHSELLRGYRFFLDWDGNENEEECTEKKLSWKVRMRGPHGHDFASRSGLVREVKRLAAVSILQHHQDGEVATYYHTSDTGLGHECGAISERDHKLSTGGGHLISRLRGQRKGSKSPVKTQFITGELLPSFLLPIRSVGGVSCNPLPETEQKLPNHKTSNELPPPPPLSPYGLLEELLWDDPWRLLLSCIMLNKTTRYQVDPVLDEFLRVFPTPEAVCDGSTDVLETIIRPLGLAKRVQIIVRFSREFLEGDDWKNNSRVLHGVGQYACDAYEIFCRGGWKKGKLVPADDTLRMYMDWVRGTEI
eukprot:396678_1